MTIDQPWRPWPLFEPDGEVHCPACDGTNVVDSGNGPNEDQLNDMHVSETPNFYDCSDCGNHFLPVDDLGHPERSLPYRD